MGPGFCVWIERVCETVLLLPEKVCKVHGDRTFGNCRRGNFISPVSKSLGERSGQTPVIPRMSRADVKVAMLYDLCRAGTGSKRLYMYSNNVGREHAKREGIV